MVVRFVWGFGHNHGVILPRGNIKETCARTVRRRIPVRSSLNAWLLESTLERGRLVGCWNWPAILVETGIPILRYESLAHQKFSGGPVQDVKNSVPVGPKHHFPQFALPLNICENRDLVGIVIALVMGRKLVIPFHFSCICIQGDHRVGIEIIPKALVAIPSRSWISCSPICQVSFRVI